MLCLAAVSIFTRQFISMEPHYSTFLSKFVGHNMGCDIVLKLYRGNFGVRYGVFILSNACNRLVYALKGADVSENR